MKRSHRLPVFFLLACSTCLPAQDCLTCGPPKSEKTGLWKIDEYTVWKDGLHPFLEPQLGSSAGYNIGFEPAAGIEWQTKAFLFRAKADYGFIRKTNDNDQVPHEHGHTRAALGELFWHRVNNFFGLGASWGETAVTPYRKYAWEPEITYMRNLNDYMRVQFSYFRDRREYTDYPSDVAFTPGPGQPMVSNYCLCSNGVTGGAFDWWYAPGENRHVLFHSSYEIFRFHTTVTDPYSPVLTPQQMAQKYFGGAVSVGMVIRK